MSIHPWKRERIVREGPRRREARIDIGSSGISRFDDTPFDDAPRQSSGSERLEAVEQLGDTGRHLMSAMERYLVNER